MATVGLSAGMIDYENTGPVNGRPVVCIHGYTMGASLWRPLGGLLADRGLRCTRLGRRRGYGALARCDLDDLAREWLTPPLSDRRVRQDLRHFTASLSADTMVRAAERLPGFERPALIAWSADDKFFPLEDAKRLAATLPNARLEVIERARTLSMLDQPERLAALMGEFATSSAAVVE